MRGQRLLKLLWLTVAFCGVLNAASQLDKPENNVPILLSPHNNDEERGVQELVSSLKSPLYQRWAITKKKPQAWAFKLLQLHKEDQELFKRRRFLVWVHFMKLFHRQNPEKAIMVTLNALPHYTDDMLAKMIIEAKTVSETKSIATKVQKEQLEIWKSRGESPENVFKWLQLKSEGQDLAALVNNPEFHTWKNYVELMTSKTEKANLVIVKALMTTYNDDEQLARMLIASKKRKATKEMATELQQAQLQILKSRQESPENLFRWFQLEDESQDLATLFQNPEFHTWIKYVNMITTDSEEANIVLVKTLTTFSSDQVLAKMLIASKQQENLKQLATELQQAQLQILSGRKESPKHVFKWLQLEDESQDLATLFQNPEFHTWIKYVNMITTDSEEANIVLVKTLTTFSTDQALAKMLIASKQRENLKQLATELQQAQLQILKSRQESPENLFRWFQLEDESQDLATLFQKPEFHTWIKYVNMVTTDSEEANIVLVKTLTTFSTDQALAKMLIASKQRENLKQLATELQQGQLQLWRNREESPSPGDVFLWLQLEDASQDLATLVQNPEFRTWMNYLDLITKKTEDANQLIVKTLTTYNGSKRLMKMLIASRDQEETREVATALLEAQLQYLLTKRENPVSIRNWMGFDGKANANGDRELWQKYNTDFRILAS